MTDAELLKAYIDTGLTPEEICIVQENLLPIQFSRFHEIMEAERAGRLVVLPCKVGDTVYVIDWYSDCEIDGYGVCDEYETNGEIACAFCPHDVFKKFVSERRFEKQEIADFGKTIFLTREEAEAALKEEV